MDKKGLAQVVGLPAFAGVFALTFPAIPLPIGLPLMAIFGALALWGFSDEIVSRIGWLQRFQSEPMSFMELTRRMAFKSIWAVSYSAENERDWEAKSNWMIALKRHFCAPLASGKIEAFGIKGTKEQADIAHSFIPKEFWQNADFDIALSLFENEADFASGKVDGEDVFYTQIRFNRRQAQQNWLIRSKRKQHKKPSPFIAWAQGVKSMRDKAVAINQREWMRVNGPLIFGEKWEKMQYPALRDGRKSNEKS